MSRSVARNSGAIPTTLAHPDALRFWVAVCMIGASTGLAAAALTRLLEVVQRLAWRGSGTNILAAARQASGSRHVVVLLAAGILTGVGQFILKQLSSGNGIDTTAAHLVLRRTHAGPANSGQRAAVDLCRWHGRIHGPGRCTQAGRCRIRQFLR